MNATSDAPLGFIGTGNIGRPMAERLLAAGHRLRVLDTSPEALAPLIEAGAETAASPADIARNCRTCFLSLPGPAEIEAVVAGPDGLLAGMRDGDVIVDLSTNSHAMVARLAEAATARGVVFLDAPVSGGAIGARAGTLAVMLGGPEATVERVRPLLAAFAQNVFHVGETGMGTIAKLVNNQLFLSCSVLLQEGFVLAAKAGLDSTRLLEILQASSGKSYSALAPFLLSRKFDDEMFQLAIATKDIAVTLDSADALGVAMPTTTAALSVYRDAGARGLGTKAFHATLLDLEARADTVVERPRRSRPA